MWVDVKLTRLALRMKNLRNNATTQQRNNATTQQSTPVATAKSRQKKKSE